MTEAGRSTLAVDLGGTWMRAALVESDGAVTSRRVLPTPRDASCPDALLELIAYVLERSNVEHAVIGVPGRVHYRHGRLEHAPNLPPQWPSAIDERQLTDHLGVEVSLANDADLAAVGEAYFGAGRDHDDIVYLTVSTGIGAGVLLERRLVTGQRSLAEIGHTVIEHTAARRGEASTLEQLGSGTQLGRRAAAGGLPADGAHIVALVRNGEPGATQIWNDLASVIATGVVNLAYLFSPQVIILGGGVGRNGDLLIPHVCHHLAVHGPRGLAAPIEIRVAELGDDAGLIGAAAWRRARAADRR